MYQISWSFSECVDTVGLIDLHGNDMGASLDRLAGDVHMTHTNIRMVTG